MKKIRVHFKNPRNIAICGQENASKLRTTNWEEVTCGNCRKKRPVEQPTVPMSIHAPLDNAATWLDDEPWRTW